MIRENLSRRRGRNVNTLVEIEGVKLANFKETQLTARLRKEKENLWREMTRKKDKS